MLIKNDNDDDDDDDDEVPLCSVDCMVLTIDNFMHRCYPVLWVLRKQTATIISFYMINKTKKKEGTLLQNGK